MKKKIINFLCCFIFSGYWRGRYRDFLMEMNIIDDLTGLLTFRFSYVAPKTVLLIEPNHTHGEVLPGFAKYWLDLGYHVDVLIHSAVAKENPFCRFATGTVRQYKHSALTITSIMKSPKLKKYDVLFLTTTAYYSCKGIDRRHISFYEYIKKPDYGNTLLFIEHDLTYITHFQEKPFLSAGNLFTLLNLTYADIATRMVNPHYFGNVLVLKKNIDCVQFIVVGNVEKQRRNYSLLIETAEELLSQGVTNFKFNIIGRGSLQEIPVELQPFFDIKGRLNFSDMFSCLEKADFLLTLLDSRQEEHKRYLTVGVTGSLQLILGFQKPGVLQTEFADFYGFSEKDSVIYHGSALAHAIQEAINISPEKYATMQAEIKKKANRMYQESKKNLERIMVNAVNENIC